MSEKRTKFPFLPIIGGLLGALLFTEMLIGASQGIVGRVLGQVGTLFAPAPLILAGLTYGLFGFAISAGAGLVALALAAGGVGRMVPGGVGIVAGLYIFFDILPALVIIGLGLLYRPAGGEPWHRACPGETLPGDVENWLGGGDVLAWLTLTAGVLVMLMMGILAPNLGAVDSGLFQDLVAGFLGRSKDALLDNLSAARPDLWARRGSEIEATVSGLVETLAAYLPAILAMAWLVRGVLSAGLADWIANRHGTPLRPAPDMKALRLPEWIHVALGLAVLVSVVTMGQGNTGYVALNLALVAAVPLMFAGISQAHILARRTPFPRLVLVVFYVLFLIPSVMLVLLVGLGAVDQGIGKNRKIREKKNGSHSA